MRRDLIIGILASILLHGLPVILAEVFKGEKKKPAPKQEAPAVVIEMVKIEEEPEIVESDEPAPDVSQIAPPSLTDVPSTVSLNDFTQQIQPPPPPNMGQPTGLVNIPQKIGTGAGRRFGEIFDLSQLDQQPQWKAPPNPQYPFEMKRMAIEGEVLVEFLVDPNGNVVEPRVVRSSQREFEVEAVRSVQKLKFRPGRRGGKNVTTRMQLPISFKISADE